MSIIYEVLERAWVKATVLMLPIINTLAQAWNILPENITRPVWIISLILSLLLIRNARKNYENACIDNEIKKIQRENLLREAAHLRRKDDLLNENAQHD